MALRFARSILNWKCGSPRQEYQDISEVILQRLSQILEYIPIGKEDRKSEQMRVLADCLACWISDILLQVSDKHKDILEEECRRRKQEQEELTMRLLLEEQDEEEDLMSLSDEACDEELDSSLSKIESVELATESAMSNLTDSTTQYEPEEEEEEPEPVPDTISEPTVVSEPELSLPCIEEESFCEPVEQTQQTEQVVLSDAQVATEVKECDDRSDELEKLLARLAGAFKTDLPWLTFARIFDALHEMIECEEENDLTDPLNNRIHRAIYEKFEEVFLREDPKLLSERNKDLVDVTTGKIALWLRRILKEREIKFLDEYPPEVESKEVRDWSKWLTSVADFADDWSNWISKIATEASCIKCKGKITRGDWQDWTSKFESNALLWRRTFLEAIHKQHHNTMMITDRTVVKTGQKTKPEWPASEVAIKNTIFDPSRSHFDPCGKSTG